MVVGGQRQARPPYPRERPPVPIIGKAGWAPGPIWTGAENIAPTSGFDSLTVQPVASRFTDCAIPAAILCVYGTIIQSNLSNSKLKGPTKEIELSNNSKVMKVMQ